MMASRAPTGSSAPFFALGHEQTESAVALQKEVLGAYEKASRLWLERVKSELALWSDLTAKLTATRSANEALEAYAKSVAQRMQMTVEDGQRLFEAYQEMTQRVTGPLTNGMSRKNGK